MPTVDSKTTPVKKDVEIVIKEDIKQTEKELREDSKADIDKSHDLGFEAAKDFLNGDFGDSLEKVIQSNKTYAEGVSLSLIHI